MVFPLRAGAFLRPYCRHRALFPMVGVRSALPALCSCLTIRSFAGSSSCSCGLAHHNFKHPWRSWHWYIHVTHPLSTHPALHPHSLPYVAFDPWGSFHVISGGFRPPDQLMFAQPPTQVARPGMQDPCAHVAQHAPCALPRAIASV
jgi:hypothetical protein